MSKVPLYCKSSARVCGQDWCKTKLCLTVELPLEPFSPEAGPSRTRFSHSLALADYSQIDILVWRYTPVNFGAAKSPGSPDW